MLIFIEWEAKGYASHMVRSLIVAAVISIVRWLNNKRTHHFSHLCC